jgi:putative acetyltransferase
MIDQIVRPETPADREGIFRTVASAFGSDAEARLVDRLREQADPFVSLVIDGDPGIAGHVALSPVTIATAQGDSRAMGLAPLAIAPDRQRSGLGGVLVRAALEASRSLGEPVVFVLGHAEYYPRFGFAPAHERGLFYVSDAFASSFFVLELEPGSLAGRRGEVRYHSAFEGL